MTGQVEIDVDQGKGSVYSGQLNVIGPGSGGTCGASCCAYGSTAFTGTLNGTQCNATGQPTSFKGTCTASSMNLTYNTDGQTGTMQLSTQNCSLPGFAQ
jgi:hypothetical protein